MNGKQLQSVKQTIERVKEPLLAFLAALLIICFVISHTRVPTESMKPTVSPGDHLIVSRIPYYYRDPMRNEVIVFNYGSDYLIKRVIGVPGDVIDIKEDHIYINGRRLDESAYLDDNMKTYAFAGSTIKFPYVVPKDSYFVMGDNRTNSMDSRVFGPVLRSQVIAKAGVRIFPFEKIGGIK